MVQTVIPDHFLISTKYYVPILQKTMPSTRPMDNVTLGPYEPQEEEFALLRMGSPSPLERLLFPPGKSYFLEGYKEYIPRGKRGERWNRNLDLFFRKITLETGLRIVSKNPSHTLRTSLLEKLFPGAKFIHIMRDPLVVVPSTCHMWNKVAEGNRLYRRWNPPGLEAAAKVYRQYLDHVQGESTRLKPGSLTEVSFEKLEKDPEKELRRIYRDLDLEFSEDFAFKIHTFLEGNRGYRKNSYPLSEEEQRLILEIMG
jgi:hypothetical protein